MKACFDLTKDMLIIVRHERRLPRKRKEPSGAAQEMREGPSNPVCRYRLQTTLSYCGGER
jgi:hypothetical protein